MANTHCMLLTEGHRSPVLSKRPIVLLHGLDLGVLVSVLFLFDCRIHTLFSLKSPSMHADQALKYRDNITWIFATLVPLDEAHDEKDQDEEGDGTHQPNEPPLGGDVYLPAGDSWAHRGWKKQTWTSTEKKGWILFSSCWVTRRWTEAVNTQIKFRKMG